MVEGYITCAYGRELYLEQAVSLACSIKRLDNVRQLALVTDSAMKQRGESYQRKGIFDKVIVMDSGKLKGLMGKIACAEVTPFERTMFLDSDCLFVRDVEFVWETMRSQDFCIQGEVNQTGSYLGVEIEFWLRRFNIDALPIFNSGCYTWNIQGANVLNRAAEILSSSDDNRLPVLPNGFVDDQPAIGIAMAELGIKPLPNVLNLHFSTFGGENLRLDFENKYCGFQKGDYRAEPCVLHYNSLASVEMYRSRSRKVLEQEVAKLRSLFGLEQCPWPTPDLRTFLWLLKSGNFRFRDLR